MLSNETDSPISRRSNLSDFLLNEEDRPLWTMTTGSMKVSWGALGVDDIFSIITVLKQTPTEPQGIESTSQHRTPIYSLIILQYILSVYVLMKIKYSFNSKASWWVRRRGSTLGKFLEFLELNHSLCSRLPLCIISGKSLTFPCSHIVVLSLWSWRQEPQYHLGTC